MHNAMRGVEVVFHHGALGSVPRSVQDPLTTSAVNVEGTLNVLLAARDEGVRRVSSRRRSSVYGNTRRRCRATEDAAPDPISPYGVSKLAAERYCVSLRARLRARDGRAPLLQRLRPAAEPDLAVRRRRAALHHRDRRGRARHDLRRRRAVARLHVRRQRRRREHPRSRGARGASGASINVATGDAARASTRSPTRSARCSASPSRRSTSRRAPATSATRGPTSRPRATPARLGAADRPRGRTAPDRRSVPRACLTSGRGPARDRPPEHGRACAARRVPLGRAARSAATRRRSSREASRAARTRWRSSPTSSA